jgi:hypothetical protein
LISRRDNRRRNKHENKKVLLMNSYCERDCKHKEYCRLSEKDTESCKVGACFDGKLFGHTWKEIDGLQQRKAVANG